MKILFVAAEGHPFKNRGGLGDVIMPSQITGKSWAKLRLFFPYYDIGRGKVWEIRLKMFFILR